MNSIRRNLLKILFTFPAVILSCFGIKAKHAKDVRKPYVVLPANSEALKETKDSDLLIIHTQIYSRGKMYNLNTKITRKDFTLGNPVHAFFRPIHETTELHFNDLPITEEGMIQLAERNKQKLMREFKPPVNRVITDKYVQTIRG